MKKDNQSITIFDGFRVETFSGEVCNITNPDAISTRGETFGEVDFEGNKVRVEYFGSVQSWRGRTT